MLDHSNLFESRVILDGSQTVTAAMSDKLMFESRVILDGSQTRETYNLPETTFESRVVLDGSQTARPALLTLLQFESRVVFSIYAKNPSCFPTKTERVVVAETGLEPAASGL